MKFSRDSLMDVQQLPGSVMANPPASTATPPHPSQGLSTHAGHGAIATRQTSDNFARDCARVTIRPFYFTYTYLRANSRGGEGADT